MKILAVLKQNKILGNIYFSEKIFYRKQSFGAPVFLRYSRTKKTPFKAIKKEGSKSLKIDIFPLNRRTRVESIYWTASASEQFSLSKLAAERLKDSHFFLYLPIENPSKRPRTSPGGKLKSHSFWKVKMCSKIYTCQPENCPADCLFLIGYH